MKSASIAEVKKELTELPKEKLVDICLQLSKFKKENKELLHYLLFESHVEENFAIKVKCEIDSLVFNISSRNPYLVKKSIHKIVKVVNQYLRFNNDKIAAIEILMYLFQKIKNFGSAVTEHPVVENIMKNIVKKIEKSLAIVHEDLQYDYRRKLDELVN